MTALQRQPAQSRLKFGTTSSLSLSGLAAASQRKSGVVLMMALILLAFEIKPTACHAEKSDNGEESKTTSDKQSPEDGRNPRIANPRDGRNQQLEAPQSQPDEEFDKYAIYGKTAPRPEETEAIPVELPLKLDAGDRIALIGNTLLERERHFGFLETLIQQRFPEKELTFRNLAWSADSIRLRPRPENFADLEQHLLHQKIDVIFAAFGFNESFAGEEGLGDFKQELSRYLRQLKTKAYNGESAAKIVLLSPIANENIPGVPAGDLNNERLRKYADVMREVAELEKVGFVDLFGETAATFEDHKHDQLRKQRASAKRFTINGAHLNEAGYKLFSEIVYRSLFGETPPEPDQKLRATVVDKDRQFFRRYRPLNSFYYTGGRRKDYGYLDFLPAMRNFDLMVEHRDQLIHQLANGIRTEDRPIAHSDEMTIEEASEELAVPLAKLDESIPLLPKAIQLRGDNEWLSAADEKKAFEVDSRFEVNLFASEEQFPEIACPIQIRWDSRGRLWVSCSTTYPHVYPGNEPNDKLVILEDTDGDGRADESTVFADNLHLPLSFEFGDGGVYVSEQPHLTFLQDTDGDGKADLRRIMLHGFGTEDSHHSLHDFTWTPDGDLIWRESIFHHSQVETPYGPVRMRDSGWFRFQPRNQRLATFGTYRSTNPWGVTFDDWGQHVASHPVYAAAFHALNPLYPEQHPRPTKLQAYSGVCGHQFVHTDTFPEELQGHMIKVRYKPTNRIEILKWKEGPFGYEEEYVDDLLFSTNLSFIPVDLQFGPRGALYVCDWYNPVKGHMQYSLRDERRDRHSGRIWRITAKEKSLNKPPQFAQASIPELLDLLKRPEPHIRMMSKRELRGRDQRQVAAALETWVDNLSEADPRYRHHQLEALWTYRWIGAADHLPAPLSGNPAGFKAQTNPASDQDAPFDLSTPHNLLRDLLVCENHQARAAATQQLRYFWPQLEDHITLLRTSANDSNGIVRMEAAIAASYVGSKAALEAILDLFKYPRDMHLTYAIRTALGSAALRQHWEGSSEYQIAKFLKSAAEGARLKEPKPTPEQARFDAQTNLKNIRMGCVPERMRFTVERFDVTPGQPVKIVFVNPDATDHNLLIVEPGALADVGIAANEMAKDRKNATSDFIPSSQQEKILQAANMIGPSKKSRIDVLRFEAPKAPGVYPYVCTFPGHWVVMNGVMVVAENDQQAEQLLADAKPAVIKEWKMEDFSEGLTISEDETARLKGMSAFIKARCNQCHQVAGKGVNLGPDLADVSERYQGMKLLRQILEPSHEIHKDYKTWQFITTAGKVISGIVKNEDEEGVEIITNLLTPDNVIELKHREIEVKLPSQVSSMPTGLVNVLTKEEIEQLISFLQHIEKR